MRCISLGRTGMLMTVALMGCAEPATSPFASEISQAGGQLLAARPLLSPANRPDVFIDFILHLGGGGLPNNCVIIGARSGTEVDMSGAVIGANGLYYVLPQGTIVPAGGRLVVHWNATGPTTPGDVWTGPGLGDFSQVEGEVVVLEAKPGRHVPTPSRVIDYVRWDTDADFGNAGAMYDPRNERAAMQAGLWDGSYTDVAGADFTMYLLALLNPEDGAGVTGSDYGLTPR